MALPSFPYYQSKHPAGCIFVELTQKQDKEAAGTVEHQGGRAGEGGVDWRCEDEVCAFSFCEGWAMPMTCFILFFCSDDGIFALMALDAMLAVKTTNMRGDIKYPVKAVNMLKAHGRSARESFFRS
jgi:hypothetical protein